MHPKVCFREWYRVFRKRLRYMTGPFEDRHRMIQRHRRGGRTILTNEQTLIFSRDEHGGISITLS